MPLRWDPWNEVAVSLDGTLRIKTRLASSTVELTTTVAGIDVVARGKSVPYGGRDHTRVSAEAPGAPELRVMITAPTEIGPRGMGPVKVTDSALNRRGTVYSNDAGLARTWLDEEVREHVIACPYRVELRGGVVSATSGELEGDADRLAHVIRAVAHIAVRGTGLRRAWMHLAEDAVVVGSTARKDRLSALPALQIKHGGATITISPMHGALGARRHGRRFFTKLQAERRAHTLDDYVLHPTYAERALKPRAPRRLRHLDPSPLDRWTIECADEARMRARIGRPIPELLERSGVAAITADHQHITVFVPGLIVDDVQLRAAVALTAKLAVEVETEAAGPYR